MSCSPATTPRSHAGGSTRACGARGNCGGIFSIGRPSTCRKRATVDVGAIFAYSGNSPFRCGKIEGTAPMHKLLITAEASSLRANPLEFQIGDTVDVHTRILE